MPARSRVPALVPAASRLGELGARQRDRECGSEMGTAGAGLLRAPASGQGPPVKRQRLSRSKYSLSEALPLAAGGPALRERYQRPCWGVASLCRGSWGMERLDQSRYLQHIPELYKLWAGPGTVVPSPRG